MSSANITQMILLCLCIFLVKSSFPVYMFCWFCLSTVRYIFHFLICISFEYLWKMCLNMIFHFWILLNILPWMIMLFEFLARHSNEKQIQACLEPLPVPCQRNRIVWVLFGWFWSKSGFWLSIILRRSQCHYPRELYISSCPCLQNWIEICFGIITHFYYTCIPVFIHVADFM